MMHGTLMSRTRTLLLIGAASLVAACGGRDNDSEPEATPTSSPSPVSILRPDVEQPQQSAVLAQLQTRIGFPDGGSELSEAALAELATVRESPQVTEGGEIILRGHSDASGNGAANLRASRARAEAVRDWLVEMGVGEKRIRVIAFGEQNPIEPNALPDGTPNEEGREANRRVDVTVRVPQDTSEASAGEGQADGEGDSG